MFLKSLVDTVVEARADFAWWRPVLASLVDQPPFSALPSEVAREVRKYLADGRSQTRALSLLWTECFKKLEAGETPPWHPPEPPVDRVVTSERPRDWNQVLALNELCIVLGGAGDDGIYVRDPGILDIGLEDIAVMLRRLVTDLDRASFSPKAVLAHDREALPVALALAQKYAAEIEPSAAVGNDCLYVYGNLSYAGALERERMMLEELRPRRTVTVALLLTENPNALRLLPDVIGTYVGSGALPWGKPAGLGVLLHRADADSDEEAIADRERFECSRDSRTADEIAADVAKRMEAVTPEAYETHSIVCGDALRRLIERKKSHLQPFGWRILRPGEETADWHTLLPPFPSLVGTPFSELPAKPTVSQLREAVPEEEQLKFMEWVGPTLARPSEVWVKQDVRGDTYTHYIAIVRDARFPDPLAFVVETVPHGEELALNNYTLFLRAEDANELRFGRLVHSEQSSQGESFPSLTSLN